MEPYPCCLMHHRGRLADIGRRLQVDEFQRPIRWRLEIECRNEPAGLLLQHREARMRIRAIKLAAGGEHAVNDPCPISQVGQPAKRSPGRKDEIERAGRELRSLSHPPLYEGGVEPGLLGKTSRDVDRRRREIESGGDGAASREAERVAPNMALQMEDALPGNIAEFCRLDSMQKIFPCPKAGKAFPAERLARVEASALIPVAAIDLNRIVHGGPQLTSCKPRPGGQVRNFAARKFHRFLSMNCYSFTHRDIMEFSEWSLALDVGRFDNRPPSLDLGLLERC